MVNYHLLKKHAFIFSLMPRQKIIDNEFQECCSLDSGPKHIQEKSDLLLRRRLSLDIFELESIE